MRLRLCVRRMRLRLRGRRPLSSRIMPGIFSLTKQKSSGAYQPLDSGIFHYLRESGASKKRIHLRVDSDGSGVLIINASRMYHFNPSAALMARMLLDERSDAEIIKQLGATFDVKRLQAEADYQVFKNSFERMISPTDDPCPICDLDVETITPFSRQPSAPYRMDLALTYRCNNRCIHCYNEASRAHNELSTAEWKSVLDRVWNLGIPHVVFTGGEPTLKENLPELIAYAEHMGLITGLNTNGRRLSQPVYLKHLVDAGLDHVQITLESHDPSIHDTIVASSGAWEQTVKGIINALSSKLFVMTNTTLLRSNSQTLAETLKFLSDLRVPTVGLNGLIYSGRGESVNQEISESDLTGLLEIAKDHVAHTGQRLIWYTPTLYCHFNPIESGLGVKGCTAALYNMCVEPDGSVLPCQSYYQPLGSLLTDPWETIWNHDLALALRERKTAPEGCRFCDVLDTCGGGCPLYIRNNPEVLPQPINALPF
jgi:radical SAM protein with 4Fe4S-binding SPASM domain